MLKIGTFLRGRSGQSSQRRLASSLIAFTAELGQFRDLLGSHSSVFDLQHLNILGLEQPVLIHTDDRLTTRVNARLGPSRCFFYAQLRNSGFNGPSHSASCFDFLDVLPGSLGQISSQAFDVVRATPRIDDAGRSRFLL